MAKPVEQTDGIPIYCAHDAMVATSVLEGNPRNPNRHPDEQIRLLAKIIVTQGWRAPITVSKRSGQIVRGHGRLLAAQAAGLTFCPVDYQDYESDEAEYADLVADNRLAELAELDRPTLKDLLQDLDTGALDMELTGFTEDALASIMSEHYVDPDEHWKGMPEFDQPDFEYFKVITVRFLTAEDYSNFGKLIGQKLSEATKAIWVPKQDFDQENREKVYTDG